MAAQPLLPLKMTLYCNILKIFIRVDPIVLGILFWAQIGPKMAHMPQKGIFSKKNQQHVFDVPLGTFHTFKL